MSSYHEDAFDRDTGVTANARQLAQLTKCPAARTFADGNCWNN
jgi:hypothetical protein